MSFVFADRTTERTQSEGVLTTIDLVGTITGFKPFLQTGVVEIGDTFHVLIKHISTLTGEWQVCEGTLASATEITVGAIFSSSNANAAVNFSAGYKYVILDVDASLLTQMLNGSSVDWASPGAIGSTTPNTGAFTSGAFSGSLTVDTNTFYVNPTTNRVGILTTSPGVDLDINSTIDDIIAARVKNSSAHQYASAAVIVDNNVSSMQFAKLSTAYAIYKTMVPNATIFYNNGGNMAFLNDHATGDISFLAGGAATPQMVIAANSTTTFTSPVVLSGGSTLTTPTIPSFVNALHDHLDPEGGGGLDAAAIVSGVIDSARLPAASVDWTTPGTLGSATPNTVKATTIESTGNVLMGPAGAAMGAGRLTLNGAASSKMIVMRQNATSPGDIFYVRNSTDARTVFQVNSLGGIYVQNSAGDPGSLDGGASWSVGADGSNNLIFRTNGRFDFTASVSGEIKVPATIAFPSSTSIALNVNGGTLLTQTRSNIGGSGAAFMDIVKAGTTQSTNDIARWTDQAGSTVYARITSAGVGRFTGLQIDVAPVTETFIPTQSVTINVNGVAWKVPGIPA